MSKIAGNKRKSSPDSKDLVFPQEEKHHENHEDKLLEDILRQINTGDHPELKKRVESLKFAKQQKINAAERHKRLQIKSLNQQFEYEVADANALFERAYVDLQERLIEEISTEMKRVKKQKQSNNLEIVQINVSTDSSKKIIENGEHVHQGFRSLRSNGEDRVDYANMNNGKLIEKDEKSGNGNSINGVKRKLSTNVNGLPKALNPVLPESTMRADFLEIVRDLQTQAIAFQRSKPQGISTEVQIDASLNDFKIGKEIYSIGDLVIVFSVSSQENISGVITAISHRELIVRTSNGSRFAFLIGQIRTGRISISKDINTISNAEAVKAAVEMNEIYESVPFLR